MNAIKYRELERLAFDAVFLGYSGCRDRKKKSVAIPTQLWLQPSRIFYLRRPNLPGKRSIALCARRGGLSGRRNVLDLAISR
jgi:hypothetical protein